MQRQIAHILDLPGPGSVSLLASGRVRIGLGRSLRRTRT